MKTTIIGLFAGASKPLGERVGSSMRRAFDGPLRVTREALEDNQTHNPKRRGDPDRIIHQFSADTYELLKAEFPEIAHRFTPGSYGENLCAPGMTDEEVCLGDVYRVGSTVLQVTEPRDPCDTIDEAYGVVGIKQLLLERGRCGWLYRVLEEGTIQRGDPIELMRRPHPEISVHRVLVEVKLVKGADEALNRALLACPELSQRYRGYLEPLSGEGDA